MIRRDGLKLLGASVVAAGTAVFSGRVLAAGSKNYAVFDGRFAAARMFAANYSDALDCQLDAAGLWFGVLWPRYRPANRIVGCTTAADAMILADCARREGLTYTVLPSGGGTSALSVWAIE